MPGSPVQATPQALALKLAGGAASLQPPAAWACVKPVQRLYAPSRFFNIFFNLDFSHIQSGNELHRLVLPWDFLKHFFL